MTNHCQFDVGHAVDVQGICGKVVERFDQPGGVILHVLLPGGGIVKINCAQARTCAAVRFPAPCGALTQVGSPCKRIVTGGGRCHQHGE